MLIYEVKTIDGDHVVYEGEENSLDEIIKHLGEVSFKFFGDKYNLCVNSGGLEFKLPFGDTSYE